MTTNVLRLESFDATTLSLNSHKRGTDLDEAYNNGYSAGVAAAEAKMTAAADQLQAEFVRAVEHAILTHETAQEIVVATVKPLLDQMIATVLPASVLPVLSARLQELALNALQADMSAKLTVGVPQDHAEAVTRALAGIAPANLAIRADPALSNGMVWLSGSEGETVLDIDSALEAIADQITALETLLTTSAEAS